MYGSDDNCGNPFLLLPQALGTDLSLGIGVGAYIHLAISLVLVLCLSVCLSLFIFLSFLRQGIMQLRLTTMPGFMKCWRINRGFMHVRQTLYQLNYTVTPPTPPPFKDLFLCMERERENTNVCQQLEVRKRCGWSQSNSGLLKEQDALLTTGPSIKPPWLAWLETGSHFVALTEL